MAELGADIASLPAIPRELAPPLHRMHVAAGDARLYRLAESPLGGGTKRAVDVAIASSALALLSPLLLLCAFIVKCESPGPALFTQWRAGFRGRAFRIYKLRTMSRRESGREIVQARRGDPRVTRFGRLLRRLSIDELPQLYNVVRGDMSIVGPRPHAIAHEVDFRRAAHDYAMRRIARPGLTGLAQVSGARGPTQTPDQLRYRVECDLTYLRRWSLWLDLLIMAKTALVVLHDPAAF